MTTLTAPRSHYARLGLLICALLVAGVFLHADRAVASGVTSAGASSVAVVDLAKLLDGLDERVHLEQSLNKEIEIRQNELNTVLKQIERMTEDIKMLSENDPNRLSRIRDLRLKEVEARALRQFVQEQLSLEKGRMLAQLFNKVQRAVSDIAARDGWDLVMIDDSALDLPEMATEQQMLQMILSRRVLSATKRVEITDDVRTLMNNQFNAARP